MGALILTAALDPASQAFFDRERERWFPPALNLIPAHVTLFHQIPPRRDDLAQLCAAAVPAAFTCDGIRFLGRGVAYSLHAPELVAFRGQLAGLWRDALSPQDRQGWRPHVTVQNKADPAEARRLHTRLAEGFMPFGGTVTGVTLWHYLGGPWKRADDLPFAG